MELGHPCDCNCSCGDVAARRAALDAARYREMRAAALLPDDADGDGDGGAEDKTLKAVAAGVPSAASAAAAASSRRAFRAALRRALARCLKDTDEQTRHARLAAVYEWFNARRRQQQQQQRQRRPELFQQTQQGQQEQPPPPEKVGQACCCPRPPGEQIDQRHGGMEQGKRCYVCLLRSGLPPQRQRCGSNRRASRRGSSSGASADSTEGGSVDEVAGAAADEAAQCSSQLQPSPAPPPLVAADEPPLPHQPAVVRVGAGAGSSPSVPAAGLGDDDAALLVWWLQSAAPAAAAVAASAVAGEGHLSQLAEVRAVHAAAARIDADVRACVRQYARARARQDELLALRARGPQLRPPPSGRGAPLLQGQRGLPALIDRSSTSGSWLRAAAQDGAAREVASAAAALSAADGGTGSREEAGTRLASRLRRALLPPPDLLYLECVAALPKPGSRLMPAVAEAHSPGRRRGGG